MPVPSSILAGVTLEFSLDVPAEYNGANGYAITLKLVNPAGSATVTSGFTANGNTFDAVIPAATTATWKPGAYTWYAFAINGSDKRLVGHGPTRVAPDVLAATTGADVRSHAAKMLAAIEATLENKATSDQQETTVDGISLKRYSFEDLGKLRETYAAEVQRETARATGKKNNQIRIRFTGD